MTEDDFRKSLESCQGYLEYFQNLEEPRVIDLMALAHNLAADLEFYWIAGSGRKIAQPLLEEKLNENT